MTYIIEVSLNHSLRTCLIHRHSFLNVAILMFLKSEIYSCCFFILISDSGTLHRVVQKYVGVWQFIYTPHKTEP